MVTKQYLYENLNELRSQDSAMSLLAKVMMVQSPTTAATTRRGSPRRGIDMYLCYSEEILYACSTQISLHACTSNHLWRPSFSLFILYLFCMLKLYYWRNFVGNTFDVIVFSKTTPTITYISHIANSKPIATYKKHGCHILLWRREAIRFLYCGHHLAGVSRKAIKTDRICRTYITFHNIQ